MAKTKTPARTRDELTWLDDPNLLGEVAKRVEGEQRPRHTTVKALLRLYWQRPEGGGIDLSREGRELGFYEQLRQLTGNLTRKVIDAGLSVVCRDLAVQVAPTGADYKLRMGCKAAGRLIEGVFENTDFLSIATQAFRDAMTGDLGAVKGYVDADREEIVFERLDPLELFWVEDGTDDPRTLLHIAPVSKDVLLARYPEHAAKIRAAAGYVPSRVIGVDAPTARPSKDARTVKVVEAWARALGDGTPGRHTICLADGTILFDEAYAEELAPIAVFRWSDERKGFAGCSLARIVAPYDLENKQLAKIVKDGLAGAVPWLVAHEDAEVQGVSDLPFQRVTFSGAVPPPTVVLPSTVSPEILRKMGENEVGAFAEAGVNQNMATGSAPARYTSGAAQREFVDIANTRLLQAQKQWERGWRRAAQIVVMLAGQAKKVHVRVEGMAHYEAVSWPNLSKDKYRVSFGLASGLSLTPAGRLQDLQDLKDAGVIDVPDLMRHLKLPDVQGLADRVNAPRDLAERMIAAALDEGILMVPSSMQGPAGLSAIVQNGGQAYQRARLQGGYPAANLEALRRLIKAAQARLAPPEAANVATANATGAVLSGAINTPANDNAAPTEVADADLVPAAAV